MSISRYIVAAVVRCSWACSRLPVAPRELAEAEMAVGDERAHAARLGQRQRFAVVGLGALGIEPVGMGRDVAEQVQRMGREPGVRRRIFERAVAQAPRLVEPAEQQSGATQRVVVPAVLVDDSPRRLTLEELLRPPGAGSAPRSPRRLARGPRRKAATACGRLRKMFPARQRRDPVLEQ